MRLAGTRELMDNYLKQYRVRMLGLMLVGTRRITCFFLLCSKEFLDPCEVPLILSWLNPKYSEATMVAQYYGSLDHGASEHLMLLWAPDNYKSMIDMVTKDKERARIFRVGLHLVATSHHRRCIADRERGINAVLPLADARVPSDTNRERLRNILKKSKCCNGLIVDDLVQIALTEVEENILPSRVPRMIDGLARAKSRLASVADLERRHLRTRRILTSHSLGFQNLCSKSLLEDVRSDATASAQTAKAVAQAVGISLVDDVRVVGNNETKRKRQSACDIFLEELAAERKACGQSARSLYFAGRAQAIEAFGNLPDDQRREYED